MNHSKIYRKLPIQILISPSEHYYYTTTTTITTYTKFQIPIENSYFHTKNSIFLPFGLTRVRISEVRISEGVLYWHPYRLYTKFRVSS